MMVNTAMGFLGANVQVKLRLMEYYNNACFPNVAAARKYRIQPNDDWCAMFVSVVGRMANVTVEPEVSVYYMVQNAKAAGKWLEPDVMPLRNMAVVYDWPNKVGAFNHIGLVSDVVGDSIVTVEGNYDSTVKSRLLSRFSSQIKGYIEF